MAVKMHKQTVRKQGDRVRSIIRDYSDRELVFLLAREARLFGRVMAGDQLLLEVAEEIHQRSLINETWLILQAKHRRSTIEARFAARKEEASA